MNRIARSFLIALPLSVAALTMAPGTASAETPAPVPGPIIAMPSEPDQPGPKDIANPTPAPQPPKDIENPEPVEPDPAPVPDDKAPAPQDDPNPAPEGPGDITDTTDCTHGCNEDPTPDLPLDSGDGDTGEEDPEEPNGAPEETDEVAAPQAPADSFTTPTRVDAGLGQSDDNGVELTWLLAGGALVTASGAALAARKRANSRS